MKSWLWLIPFALMIASAFVTCYTGAHGKFVGAWIFTTIMMGFLALLFGGSLNQ
jgi:hypothetical protein